MDGSFPACARRLLRRRRQTTDLGRHRLHARRVLGAVRVAVHFARELWSAPRARAAPVFFSAASSAVAIAVVRSAARPLLRTSWSRYERTTTNAAGQTSFGWLCGLYSLQRHQLCRGDLVRRELRARRQLEDVEAAVELRRVDHSVPVVRAPRTADRSATSRRAAPRPGATAPGISTPRAVSAGGGGSIEPRSKYAISVGWFASVKSMMSTPPWYQPCT